MWKKILILGITLTCGLVVFFIILSFASAQSSRVYSESPSYPDDSQVITPTIISVSPNALRNSLQSEITILGENFEILSGGTDIITYPQIMLNNSPLKVVAGVPTQVLTAEVSCGFDTRAYTLTVTNPSGGVAQMTQAITVTTAPQVWTTGGPYGGHVIQIILSPEISTTVYARANEAGVFASHDGGDDWTLIFPSTNRSVFQNFAVNSSNPDILYVGEQQGLYSNLNAEITWTQILTGYIYSVAYSPEPPYRLYVAIDGGIRTSTDDGNTWSEPGEGLPSMGYVSIAIHPDTSTIAYASSAGPPGEGNGHIYKTIDGGATWSDLDMLPQNDGVYVFLDPNNPGDGENPAHLYATGGHNGTIFQRSLDGGLTWEAMSLPDNGHPLTDLVFPRKDQSDPGVIYGMNCWGLHKSIDYGETWTHAWGMHDCMVRIVLNPETGEPFLTGGGYRGVWKCDQDCDWDMQAWHPSSEGMRALIPERVAIADYAPWQAYTAAALAGGFFTQNGGQQWAQALVTPTFTVSDFIVSTAVDPHDPCIAYLGTREIILFRTLDCGVSWSNHPIVWKPGFWQSIWAIAVDPHDSRTVLAGGGLYTINDETYLGILYSSTNRGETWNEITFTQPISQVSSIVFDPQVTGTVYIATGGHNGDICCIGRIHKSIDGGVTWQTYQDGLPGYPISALAIDPTDSNRLYAGLIWNGPGPNYPLYRSMDGGESWQPLGTWSGYIWSITDIFINPLKPNEMYVSAMGGFGGQGVHRSIDSGENWQRIDAETINGQAYCLDGGVCASGKEPLTSLYVCTVRMPLSEGILGNSFNMPNGDEAQYGAGVFQKTITGLIPRLFLPLILR